MRTLLLSLAAVALASMPASFANAQTGNPAGANAPQYGIAVVDVSWIFKNYNSFRGKMDAMKQEMQAADAGLKADRDRIQKLEEERNDMKPGSEEFKRLDEQLAREKADFNIKAGKIRRDFLDREAVVYYDTYQEVNKAVSYYAQNKKIGLVLRFNGDKVDPAKREDVLRAINQPIVYQNSIDITPDVLAMLNPQSSAQRANGSVTK